MILKPEQHHTVLRYGMMLFCFFLPLAPRVAVYLSVAIFVSWLFTKQLKIRIQRMFRLLPLLFLTFFVLYLIGMIYTEDIAMGWSVVERKLSFLIFPLLFFTAERIHKEECRRSLDLFLLGCTAASLYCLGCAGWDLANTGANHFFYKDLGAYLKFHPTYFAMYIGFCLFLVLRRIFFEWYDIRPRLRWIYLGLVPYWAIFLVLLSARMQLLILALLLSISLVFWMYQQRQLLKGLTVAVGMAFLGGIFLVAVPSTSYRFTALVEKIRSGETANIRIDIWRAAWPTVKGNWVKGLGTGDVQTGLDQAYTVVNLEAALSKHLNAHNQYLQTTLALGFLGLSIWVFLLFQSFLAAYRTHFYLIQWFLWLFTLSCLTESMLETQRGILFFGFIGTMLIAYHPPYEQPFSWPNRSKEQRQERRLARKKRRHH